MKKKKFKKALSIVELEERYEMSMLGTRVGKKDPDTLDLPTLDV